VAWKANNKIKLIDMPGLKTIPSNFSVKETVDRIASVALANGLTIFARIDHSANATQQKLQLRPTELIIFGNAKGGTPLMQDKQTSGIDLPLKALAWQDESEKIWLTYNEMSWLKDRHELTDHSDKVLKILEDKMDSICNAATKNSKT
jgi:uncharacterized protein (DUF302 family)